jgi:hypothetical protein
VTIVMLLDASYLPVLLETEVATESVRRVVLR